MNVSKAAPLIALSVIAVILSFGIGYWLAVLENPVPSASERRAKIAAELKAAIEDAGLDLGLRQGAPCEAIGDSPDDFAQCAPR